MPQAVTRNVHRDTMLSGSGGMTAGKNIPTRQQCRSQRSLCEAAARLAALHLVLCSMSVTQTCLARVFAPLEHCHQLTDMSRVWPASRIPLPPGNHKKNTAIPVTRWLSSALAGPTMKNSMHVLLSCAPRVQRPDRPAGHPPCRTSAPLPRRNSHANSSRAKAWPQTSLSSGFRRIQCKCLRRAPHR
jgi:hypothetical protein